MTYAICVNRYIMSRPAMAVNYNHGALITVAAQTKRGEKHGIAARAGIFEAILISRLSPSPTSLRNDVRHRLRSVISLSTQSGFTYSWP